jgi:hypothetical protein
MEKSVLVNYLERNKIFTIPALTNLSDIAFLETQFRKEFMFQRNVNIGITFQRYDSDWGEYIDAEQDCQLNHKEKLKVVVTPLLSDFSQTATCTPSISDLSDEVIENKRLAAINGTLNSDELDMTAETDFESSYNAEVEVQPEDGYVSSDVFDSKRKRKKITKTEDDIIPLPDPFPLPKHYRADVEVALRNKTLTSETTKSFLSSVAAAMLAYKRYPTREDYVNVGRSVIQQYEFMAQPTGAPYGGIVQSLMNRFKEFRRPSPLVTDSPSPPTLSSKKPIKRKSPGITQIPRRPPLFSPGEDAVSLERHNNLLKAEFKKKKRNSTLMCDLINKTFPLRRQTILDEPLSLDSMFERFPFLQDIEQVMMEFERIHNDNNLKSEFQKMWSNIADRIISQAQLEVKNRAVQGAIEKCKPIQGFFYQSSFLINY